MRCRGIVRICQTSIRIFFRRPAEKCPDFHAELVPVQIVQLMNLLAQHEVIVGPAEACEQTEVCQILSAKTVDLSNVEKLKLRTLCSPRVDIVNKRIRVFVMTEVERNQSGERKTTLS